MRLAVLNEKVVGKKLAVPIYTQAGMVYMNKGYVLSERNVDQIKKIGVNTVYIEDGMNEVTLQEIYDTRLKLNNIRELKAAFDDCKKNNYIEEGPIIKVVEDIIDNVNISENAYLYNNISEKDNKLTLCIHSINVAILSIVVGYIKNYNNEKLLKLGIGAVLHDVGKLFKDGREHPYEGYKLMKRNSNFPLTSCACVRSHHENEDGSGYPEKLKGDKIHEFAKIVSICDEYLNTLNSQKFSLPHEAIEKITAVAAKRFDSKIYKDFMKSVYCYPNGLTVKLNNGKEAVVIKQNVGMPSRPIVGLKINGKLAYCNLAEGLTIFVDKVVL